MIEFFSVSDTRQTQPTNTLFPPQVAVTTSKVSPWLSPVLYFVGNYLLLPSFFGRISITGQENIPNTGPVILAPTHRARWDSLLLPYATGRYVTGRDLKFMVTKTECRGLQGWFVRRMGGFPIDTQHPAISTLRHAVELLQQGQMLVIYPEGNIFRDGKLHPLKSGISRLALSAESSHPGLGVKILPVSINYSQPYPCWGTDVSIHIGTAINVQDYTNGKVKQNAKRLTEDLARDLQSLSNPELAFSHHDVAEVSNPPKGKGDEGAEAVEEQCGLGLCPSGAIAEEQASIVSVSRTGATSRRRELLTVDY
ncbi:Phospholipid/glycerol acyltransferase [Trichormus variabilis ATCC 29413]|uniref:Phospholipid/glycerol acyltransferase n=2 Tax=Anabaena variabilis TaxID=264691 RepID=Q3MB75_TRIV2|nr:Phospholipid/glycerol acyltransferase [Trichormus variabilis ATCC 29413]MBC1215421.1 1-acyl-sn-glycerol-3-phosphate acyltransferase [Trichormus variabilis ARAD]MBC1255506.1 1-acyl-sn-glycerol-3-phosphate acyltransferase [Trichormus variabilis V5]MBC1267606.1 1-acyl-sn-glycerol-3-phosphate acyltransferase [Trichormus variabilis FSR]MBC1304036.1 1-acyl-sn-glycerol-3-phosphate acyltransferase [Trichormus variabilis N2B]MBC1313566.1 1-acyl-sn-glycerol-3-phosphate acyltransferase [Trichormus var